MLFLCIFSTIIYGTELILGLMNTIKETDHIQGGIVFVSCLIAMIAKTVPLVTIWLLYQQL